MDEDLYQEGLMLFQQRLAQLQAAGSLQELPPIPAADLKVLQAEAANQSSSKPTGGLVGGSWIFQPVCDVPLLMAAWIMYMREKAYNSAESCE